MLRWLKALVVWLNEAQVFWLMIGVVIAAVLFAFWPGATEPRVRMTGWVLELLGLGTVAWGIRETRRQFGRPSFLSIARGWFRRSPKFTLQVINAEAHVSLPGLTASARGYSWHNAAASAPLAERVNAIEQNLRSLNDRFEQAYGQLTQMGRDHAASLNQEQHVRESEDNKLSEKLAATETGGLHVSAVGVAWLAFGLTLSTIPCELLLLIK